MLFDDPACFRLNPSRFGLSTGSGGRTLPAASWPFLTAHLAPVSHFSPPASKGTHLIIFEALLTIRYVPFLARLSFGGFPLAEPVAVCYHQGRSASPKERAHDAIAKRLPAVEHP